MKHVTTVNQVGKVHQTKPSKTYSRWQNLTDSYYKESSVKRKLKLKINSMENPTIVVVVGKMFSQVAPEDPLLDYSRSFETHFVRTRRKEGQQEGHKLFSFPQDWIVI